MQSFPRWLIVASGLAMLALIGGGYWFYHYQERVLRQKSEADLQAAAQLKVNQIAEWRSEKLRDAAALVASPFLAEAVRRFFVSPQAALDEKILSQFRTIQELFGYRDVMLVDRDGNVRLSLRKHRGSLHADAARSLAEAMRERRPVLTDLHVGSGDRSPELDVVAPLFSGTRGSGQPVGALVFEIEAQQFLYPLIEFWPTPSRTAETLLVRRDGDAVLFLNDLRHQPDTALRLRIPLSRKDLPASMAASGKEGVVQGKDYRGAEVLAVLKAVPNSSWLIIAKVDEAEALAGWRFRSILILGLEIGLLGLLLTAVGLVWQKNGKAHYKELFVAEAALRRAEEGHRITLMSVGDAIISADADGRVELLNPVAEGLTGWRQEEARGKPLEEVFRIFSEETRQPVENPVSKVLREGLVVGLANHTVLVAKDGTERPIADSAAPIRDEHGSIGGVVLVFRDQSEERAAQKRLVQEKEKARQYLDVAGVMLLALDINGSVTLINRKGCKILGHEEQEILGKNWFERFLPENVRDEVKNVFSRIIAGSLEMDEHAENLVLTGSGEARLIAWHNAVMRGEDGSIVGTLSSGEDITERKRAEEELRRKTDLELGLAELSVKLLEPESDLDRVAFTVLRHARSLTGSEHGYVSSIDRRTGENKGHTLTEMMGDACQVSGPDARIAFPRGPDGRYGGLWGHALNTHIPFFTNDSSQHSESKGLPEGHVPLLNFLSLPVTSKGQLLGQIALANKAGGYTDDDLEVVKRLAELYGMYLHQWRLYESLKESEERFRRLYEQSPAPYQSLDADGNILEVNNAWLMELGYERGEVLGKWFGDFLSCDSLQLFRARFPLFKERGEVHGVELDMKRKDGAPITVSVEGRIVRDDTGEFLRTHCIFTNVTEARRAEAERERLVSAIEQAAEVVVITDAEGTILYVNPAFERVTGYGHDEALGKNPRILKSGEHDTKFYQNLWNTITRGGTWSGRFVNRTKDGRLYHEDATISPVKDSSGKIVNFVAVKRDITEHLDLSKQLQQAQKLEAVGALAGGVAHDFNNLLQVVLGYTEVILSDESLPAVHKDDLSKIYRAAKGGADLVQRLLTFSRKTETKARPLNLNRRIEQLEKMLSRTIPKMIQIELALACDCKAINADSMQMEQVLMNLAINARDAMPEGGKLVIATENVILDRYYARTHLGAKPGRYVLLSVSDTGAGMDKETLEHVFEPFYTTKGPGEGTGLGLSMVYGIVKQHGGHIRCYSEPGEGTIFKMYFPALTSDEEVDEVQTRQAPRGGSETILLVDDEKLILDLGSRILTKAGYRVITASDGREALEIYRRPEHDISVVIMDLIMPEMGGKKCLEEILKMDTKARVLIASGFSPTGHAKEIGAPGAKGLVSKPYDRHTMLRRVREVLDEE